MSTSSVIASYTFFSKQVTIYGGMSLFIAGVLGGILNTIVFLSLRTFRQSSCAFYLTVMSIVNIGYLFLSIFPSIMVTIYDVDGTENSLFYCKFQVFFDTICITISLTCFCLATMDQYCATCSRPRFQQWCNIKLAQRLVIIFIIIWILHSIPNLVLFHHSASSVTDKVSCIMTNTIYIKYGAYFVVLILFGFLPASITILFGFMAYINLQQLAHYALPLVRRELDKQLTTMVLAQVVVNCFAILPFTTVNTLQLIMNLNSDPVVKAQILMSYNITLTLTYLYYAVSIN